MCKIPCVFPDRDILGAIFPVFPMQWVPCLTVKLLLTAREYLFAVLGKREIIVDLHVVPLSAKQEVTVCIGLSRTTLQFQCTEIVDAHYSTY